MTEVYKTISINFLTFFWMLQFETFKSTFFLKEYLNKNAFSLFSRFYRERVTNEMRIVKDAPVRVHYRNFLIKTFDY